MEIGNPSGAEGPDRENDDDADYDHDLTARSQGLTTCRGAARDDDGTRQRSDATAPPRYRQLCQRAPRGRGSTLPTRGYLSDAGGERKGKETPMGGASVTDSALWSEGYARYSSEETSGRTFDAAVMGFFDALLRSPSRLGRYLTTTLKTNDELGTVIGNLGAPLGSAQPGPPEADGKAIGNDDVGGGILSDADFSPWVAQPGTLAEVGKAFGNDDVSGSDIDDLGSKDGTGKVYQIARACADPRAWASETTRAETAPPIDGLCDLLPLPLLSTDDFVGTPTGYDGLGFDVRQLGKRRLEVADRWFRFLVLGLNWNWHLGCPPATDDGTTGNLSERQRGDSTQHPSPVQLEVLHGLYFEVCRFCHFNDCTIPALDWDRELAARDVNYEGEEVHTATDLDISRVLEGLPPLGTGALIRAAEVCTGYVAACARDPRRMLKPPSEWSLPVRAPRVWATRGVWNELGPTLVERKICATLTLSQVFHVEGRPMLHGMFGVDNGNKQRLVMNMILLNALLLPFDGDMDKLPLPVQWFLLVIGQGLVLRWSSDDLSCCFYVYELDEPWWPLMAFNMPIAGHLVGRPEEKVVYLASRVIPMGFAPAAGMVQHIHRNLMLAHEGAFQNPGREIRRDRVLPQSEGVWSHLWQVYLDNLDILEVRPLVDFCLAKGDSEQQAAAREAYARHGIPRNLKKGEVRNNDTKALGHRVLGDAACILGPTDFLGRLLDLTWATLAKGKVGLKHMQILLGRWSRNFAYNRACSSTFYYVWKYLLGWQRWRPMTRAIQSELSMAVILMPLMMVDLRVPVSGLVTASDASLGGGAIAASTGISLWGLSTLAEKPPRYNGNELVDFGLITINDSLGTSRRALEILHVAVDLSVTLGLSDDEKRVVQYAWPDTVFLPEVEKVEMGNVEKLILACPRVAKLLVTIGLVPQGSRGPPSLLKVKEFLQHFAELSEDIVIAVAFFSFTAGDTTQQFESLGLPPLSYHTLQDPRGSTLHWWCSWTVTVEPQMPLAQEWQTATDLEVALGFASRHTITVERTSARKQRPLLLEQHRVTLLNRAAAPSTLGAALQGLVLQWGLDKAPQQQPTNDRHDDDEDATTIVKTNLYHPTSAGHPSVALVHSFVRAADQRGTDVRLDTGEPMRPHLWPRRPIRPERWDWKTEVTWKWKKVEAITVLELRALLTTLRWRARRGDLTRQRFLHLIDNQATIGVATKCRSSSHLMHVAVHRCNALTLTTRSRPHYGYVETDLNPADYGSRQGEPLDV